MYVYIYFYSIYLFVCLSIYMYNNLSIYLCICISLSILFTYMYIPIFNASIYINLSISDWRNVKSAIHIYNKLDMIYIIPLKLTPPTH